MCSRIQANNDAMDMDELDFLLRGGIVLDKSAQSPNPCEHFIDETAWDNVTELSKALAHFMGFDQSFGQHSRDWEKWYKASIPEEEPLPGDWVSGNPL